MGNEEVVGKRPSSFLILPSDLFAAGLDAVRLDILSEAFLNRVSALEQKNLAQETLRKLLTDQIKISERTNLVQVQKFREAKQHGRDMELSTEEVAVYENVR